jgi:hypothetical protein
LRKQKFGALDSVYKGSFRNDWLDGYSQILKRAKNGELNEIYSGNIIDGGIEGFGVLIKPYFRYAGYFADEKIEGFGIMEHCDPDVDSEFKSIHFIEDEEFREVNLDAIDFSSKNGYTKYKG